MNFDPRFLRSQQRLHETILRLATEMSPETITVTRLAQEAHVHRSTVYEHAESPDQLLRQAITAELDELYVKYSPTTTDTSASEAIHAVLTYLESRAGLYGRMCGPAGVVIVEAVTSHFAKAIVEMMLQAKLTLPDNSLALDNEEVIRVIARALSDSYVRIYASWLAQPTPRDPEFALQLMRMITPSWWKFA